MEGVVSVNPSRKHKLHTTRSWDFLNLTTDKLGAAPESDVVIGLLDTGNQLHWLCLFPMI